MSDLDDLMQLAVDAGISRAYEVNKVPTTRSWPYAVFSLSSPNDLGRTLDGSAWTDRRLVVQMFGKSHDSVTATADKADAAFKDQCLTDFPDEPFCWREIATGPYRDPDDSGVLSIVHTYRF